MHSRGFDRTYLGTDDLVQHFQRQSSEKRLVSLANLMEDASHLARRYSSEQAYTKALLPRSPQSHSDDIPLAADFPQGVPSAQVVMDMEAMLLEDEITAPPFQGDWPLANSVLLIRDGIWYMEVVRAVALGDIGRVWEVLKVCSFNGS